MRLFRKYFSPSTTPTNSPPQTPAQPITEYIRQELATFHPRTRDRRVLAASSSAIALAVASPFCDPTDTTPNEPGSSKESAWTVAYGAARMAVEIANASSDMFLPLKAVVGALSVLIKNYDQTTANVKQIRHVEERIQSLRTILTYPVRDQDSEEKARREVLTKKLTGIVANLGPLAQQHGLMKFLKNVDHADILNGFVQDLAYAVTDYQVSLQQSIRENTKRIDENTRRVDEKTNKINDTTNKIERTTDRTEKTTDRIHKTTNKVDETTNKIGQTTNRIEETTDKIEENMSGIGETTDRIKETTDRIEGMANKIDETTKRVDESTQNLIEAADLELLEKLNPVRSAGYQAGHHDTCLSGTRESVLDGIMRWAKDQQDRHVFWLNGLAGTGKSTIAQTFSEMVAQTGILGASFFCSRDYLDRNELKNIFPTLAYQLACRYPAFRSHIIRVIKQDPSVAQNSLISQLKDLIIDPLSSTSISCIIVIDALDECVDDQPASAILSVLGRHVRQLLLAKFFITGRPEPRIRTGFRLPLLEPLTQIFLLHEVKPSCVDEDIRLYLQEKLTTIAKQRSNFEVSDQWPCDGDLVALTKKSSGLFIFASTLVRFIESEHHEPNERLQLIVTTSDSTVHEGHAGIDSLYTQVLVLAFSDVKEDTVFANLRRVLGAVTLAFNPLSRRQIAELLGIPPSLITTALRHLHSVLLVPNEDLKEIRVFHKSFPDFLQDHDRCFDTKFFIDSTVHHGDITLDCLELLKKLKSNPCDLPDFVMNREMVNLPELLEDKVGSAARYACGHWAMHIRLSPTTNDYATRLIPSAAKFFEKSALPWIEIMSLENRLEGVIHSIYNLLDWLGKVNVSVINLRSLAQDCLRFTMHFFHPIQQSASHIYHSALPLSPKTSKFHSDDLGQKTGITKFHGRPDAWGIVVRTVAASSKHFTCIATFGHRLAAACDDGGVGIYDSVTGVLRLSLKLEDPAHAIRGTPNGSILFCAHKTPSITVWDMQTGGLIHTFFLERNAEAIAVSSKGRYLACGLSDGSVEVWEVTNTIEGAVVWARSPITCFCWLESEEQLAVSTGTSTCIWDIVAGTVLHSFTIKYPADHMVYSQKFNRLAIMAGLAPESSITVIDPLTGTSTTAAWMHQYFSCFAFSQAAEELVCGMKTHGIRIFNVPKRHLKYVKYPATMTSVSSLQNGTVMANFAGSGIQLLSLDGGDIPPPKQPPISALTVHVFDQGKIIAIYLASRNHILFLKPTPMSQLIKIPVRKTYQTPTDHTTILCASYRSTMAIYYFEEENKGFLRSWVFLMRGPRWTVEVNGVAKIGRISPLGHRLVTLHTTAHASRVYVWNAQTGQLDAQLEDTPLPLDIQFTSDEEFCLHYDTYYVSHSFPHWTSPTQGVGDPPSFPERPEEIQHLDVDDTHEWVVSGLKRVCWIPPGYIGSSQHSYCWAESSLIMVGQDEILRKLTFSYGHPKV